MELLICVLHSKDILYKTELPHSKMLYKNAKNVKKSVKILSLINHYTKSIFCRSENHIDFKLWVLPFTIWWMTFVELYLPSHLKNISQNSSNTICTEMRNGIELFTNKMVSSKY
jgi:hypothetical protein